MSIENIRQFIKEKAEQFGAKIDNEFNKPYVERNNTGQEALKDNGAYFGFIHPEEEASGPYHDFSLTIFPNDQGKPWLVCLGIGSSGFKNDYELATYPGLRRLFSKLIDFALRRRFAWYNIRPNIIEGASKRLENCSVNKITESNYFFKEDFAVFEEMFDWYASSTELNLQPGQGYFIADSEDEMKNRIRYEIFPLIKEYLQEGLLRNAKEELNNYFSSRINLSLFE